MKGCIVMSKLNCWEYMECGRGPGGFGTHEAGVCNIAKEIAANGLNGGVNGGRLCWLIAEKCSSEEVKCSNYHNKNSCFSCKFRYKVSAEEGLLAVCNSTGVLLNGILNKRGLTSA